MKTREAEIKEVKKKSLEKRGIWCVLRDGDTLEWIHPPTKVRDWREDALHTVDLGEEEMNKEISFGAVPCFYSMHTSGEMPFTLRRFDSNDWRFQLLEEDCSRCDIIIRNTETGEWIKRNVKGYEHLPPCYGDFVLIRF